MYKLSLHARRRIEQRNLTVEELLAALNGRQIIQRSGTVLFCDPLTRCAVVIDLKAMAVVTALRLKPSKYRRLFSEGKRRKNYGS